MRRRERNARPPNPEVYNGQVMPGMGAERRRRRCRAHLNEMGANRCVPTQKDASMGEQSKFAEAILDQVADAVICADRLGTIIRWNRASTALFGHSAEEAIGQGIDLIVPEHLRAAHWSGFDAAIAKGALKLQGRPTLTRALHKSGRRLYVEMTFALVKGDAESEVLGAVAVARDVTDRVERERAAGRSS